jgi:hypothetical protein
MAAELHRPYAGLCDRLAGLVDEASADHSEAWEGEIDGGHSLPFAEPQPLAHLSGPPLSVRERQVAPAFRLQ